MKILSRHTIDYTSESEDICRIAGYNWIIRIHVEIHSGGFLDRAFEILNARTARSKRRSFSVVCPFIFNSAIFHHGNGPVLKTLEIFPFELEAPQITLAYHRT